jgi:hypothetical protein
MYDNPFFLNAERWGTAELLDQLDEVDCIFETFEPGVDLLNVQKKVLELAKRCIDRDVRLEALRVLNKGIFQHSEVRVDLQTLAETLGEMEPEELALALDAIGSTGETKLADYVRPWLDSNNKRIRLAAESCLIELRALPAKPQ